VTTLPPTIFHITHWKAGSQWVRKILEACVPERIVPPQVYEVQFLQESILEGRVYPTVYVTQEQFYSVQLPQFWKKFIIIRDLRDTLISVYFSIRFSHQAIADEIVEWRRKLELLDEENGLIYLLDEWLPRCAVIQSSWLGDQDGMLKYEDLLHDDIGIFENVLIDRCQLPVSRENFRRVVNSNRFESLTAGRQRGVEDVRSHERKGISGDWKNHFTDRLKEQFKGKYGKLLIDTGYEMSMNW
jgi:lipopolysaccharide transport system ATP-binding protein